MQHILFGVLLGINLGAPSPFSLVSREAVQQPKEQPKNEEEPRWDEEVEGQGEKSKDLEKDLKTIWRTVPVKDEKFEVAPVSAINAASRVFNTVDLKGKTKQEIEKLLKYQPQEKYGYNRPFFGKEKGQVVYRFDCGNFGWEFKIAFDKDGKAESVKRQWIH
jgi:hypothetical protein